MQNYPIRKLYVKEVTLCALNALGGGLIAVAADPAMASSIFLATFTDILGMGLMLGLATTLVL